MGTPKIFESEYRFCQILWAHEPIKSTELAKLCAEKLGWSKTTTYTVIKRLCDRGAVKNESTMVSSLVSQEEVQRAEIDELLEKKFDGSLPAFVAAFTKHHSLSDAEIDAVQAMIDSYRKGVSHD
jgi:predicted transcriptional regulator